MSLFNFFRDILGLGAKQQPPNHGFEDQWQQREQFRNPIWQTDDDDDDDNDDFRQPGRGNPGAGHFNIYSDPFEITRYFENQMDSMLKNFFGFNHDGIQSPFGEGTDDSFHNSLSIEPPQRRDLRDDVLKPGYERPGSKNYLLQDGEKVDVDLDGKITTDELYKIWKNPSSSQSANSHTNTPQQIPFSFHSFGQSVTTKIIRKPDGSVEQRRTIRDSEGNEETTVTHQMGDKTHTVVIKKDKNGEKSETEITNSGNTNQPNSSEPLLSITDGFKDDHNPLSYFPWHKFFGPNPKL